MTTPILPHLSEIIINRGLGSTEVLEELDHQGRHSAKRLTATQLDRAVTALSYALVSIGLAEGDRIVLWMDNHIESVVMELAAYRAALVPVAIYATASEEQVAYVLADCGARLVFTDTPLRYSTASAHAGNAIMAVTDASDTPLAPDTFTFEGLLALGREATPEIMAETALRTESLTDKSLATLIYTSGTTGEPKGVMLTHGNFTESLHMHRRRLTMLSDRDRSLSFLPLCHVFEKTWTYFCLWRGIHVTINPNPKAIQQALRLVRPSCMCSVPRLWEKIFALAQEKMAAMNRLHRMVLRRALAVGRLRNLHYRRLGMPVPRRVEQAYRFYNRIAFRSLRRAIGVDRATLFPVAGAPVGVDVVEFFLSAGIPLMVGYGLSETTATVTCFPEHGFEIGTVGTPLAPAVEVRIGADSEIQIKGPTVMAGYWNKPAETTAAFTPDGWLHTGDAGSIDASGAITLTDRIKDLFKTSNGKYIAPQAIESRIAKDPFIDQVAIIGESRNYVTAIITPMFDRLKAYARRHKIKFKTLEDLVANTDIRSMIARRIEKMQRGLAAFEQVKKFTLLPRPFTIESGELTNTMKLRRPVIASHFASEIADMY